MDFIIDCNINTMLYNECTGITWNSEILVHSKIFESTNPIINNLIHKRITPLKNTLKVHHGRRDRNCCSIVEFLVCCGNKFLIFALWGGRLEGWGNIGLIISSANLWRGCMRVMTGRELSFYLIIIFWGK